MDCKLTTGLPALSALLLLQTARAAPLAAVDQQGKNLHRFFDTSPISPWGWYIALFRMPYENVSPRP